MENNKSKLTNELLQELQSATSPCLSLYMPTHRSHPENSQDPILFKKLVKQLADSLTKQYTPKEVAQILKPFEALILDTEFWNHTGDGLAVFASNDFFRTVNLQMPVKTLTIVANSYHTKPLRQYLQSTERYQVLDLTFNAIRVFEGNRHSLVELTPSDDFPNTMKAALGEDLTDKHTTVASYGGVGGESNKMHHGQGGRKDEMEKDTERYFRVVAAAVYNNFSKPSGLPLILAALPEHHHLFHSVSKNPLLLKKGIEINPQSVSLDRLAEMAWSVVEPEYKMKLDELAGRYKQAEANGKGSDNIEEVTVAASAGRVDTLFVEADKVLAGTIENSLEIPVAVGDLDSPEIDDVLDDLGELVINQGGNVVVVPQLSMPTDTGVAAIYRY